MKCSVYNQKGEEIEKTELPDEVFNIPMNSDLVHQVVLGQQANKRRSIAKTKNRGEVSGGGKKPWRQKGTGRARAGSNRSPIWKGGGVTFGPTTERVFKKKITKKMRRKALFMVLSAKARDNLVLIVDGLKIEKPKTKLLTKMIESWLNHETRPTGKSKIKNLKDGSGLIALPKLDNNIIFSVRNIPKISTIQARDINVLDLLSYKYLIMPKEAIKVIKETFIKNF